jgi:cyclin B
MTYKFSQETLFLAVNLFDNLAAKNLLDNSNIASIFICVNHLASKYLETYYYQISEFLGQLQQPITKTDVIVMEERILAELNYQLDKSNPFDYIQRISMICYPSFDDYVMVNMYVEMVLFYPNVMCFRPQEIALAAFRTRAEQSKMCFPLKRLKKYFVWAEDNILDIRKFISNQTSPSSSILKGILKKKYSDLHFIEKLRAEFSKI